MKKISRSATLCFLFLFPLIRTAHAQRPDTLEVGEIGRLAQEWMEAYNTNDTRRLASLYTIDADYVSPHVAALIVHGRDLVIANFQRGMSAGGHVDSIRIISSMASSDIAYAVCKYDATNNGKKASGRNVIVFRKVDGRWLFAVHASIVRD